MPARGLVCALLTAVLVGGCGKSAPPMPETVPVQGRVTFTKGGSVKDLYDRDGAIEFQSVEKPEWFAYGVIEENGSFTVSTVKEGTGVAGAIPGKHRVRLNLDTAARKLVAPQFLSFETSNVVVTLPAAGEVVVQVWR